MTLVEILASISLFAMAILLTVAGLTTLSRHQHLVYHQSLAATMAMAIGQYRAADMVSAAAQRLAGTYPGSATATDLPTWITPMVGGASDTTRQYDFWNSVSYTNASGARFHGGTLTTAGVSGVVEKAGTTGDTWMDQCPIFEPFTNYAYNDPGVGGGYGGAASLVPFSVQDRFLIVQPPVFSASVNGSVTGWGSFKANGGLPADQNFNRLYFLNPAYSTDFPLESYRLIGVSFSQPDDQANPGGGKVKGRFLVASFWLCPGTVRTVFDNGNRTPKGTSARTYNSGGGDPITFLGRYLILDALEP